MEEILQKSERGKWNGSSQKKGVGRELLLRGENGSSLGLGIRIHFIMDPNLSFSNTCVPNSFKCSILRKQLNRLCFIHVVSSSIFNWKWIQILKQRKKGSNGWIIEKLLFLRLPKVPYAPVLFNLQFQFKRIMFTISGCSWCLGLWCSCTPPARTWLGHSSARTCSTLACSPADCLNIRAQWSSPFSSRNGTNKF